MPRESKTSERRLAAINKQHQALELRLAGQSFHAIAQQLGWKSSASAFGAVESALTRTLQEPADAYRKVQRERLHKLLLGLWERAASGEAIAIDRVLKILGQLAELDGLNAPKRTEITGKDGAPIQHRAVLIAGVTDDELIGPDHTLERALPSARSGNGVAPFEANGDSH